MISAQSTIKTDIIKGSVTRYINHLAMRLIENFWLLLLIPIAVPVVLGVVVDHTWLFVAVMLTFLYYPTLLLFVFCQYALRSQARNAVFSYDITITPQSLTIRFFPLDDGEVAPPEPVFVALDEITEYSVGNKGVTVNWGTTHYDFIFIPHDSFKSLADSAQFIDWLRSSQPLNFQ